MYEWHHHAPCFCHWHKYWFELQRMSVQSGTSSSTPLPPPTTDSNNPYPFHTTLSGGDQTIVEECQGSSIAYYGGYTKWIFRSMTIRSFSVRRCLKCSVCSWFYSLQSLG